MLTSPSLNVQVNQAIKIVTFRVSRTSAADDMIDGLELLCHVHTAGTMMKHASKKQLHLDFHYTQK
jgi:hypothetical protein